MSGITDSIEAVQHWVRDGGKMPDDWQLCLVMRYLVSEWEINRATGMDVLASGQLDDLLAIVTALRERT